MTADIADFSSGPGVRARVQLLAGVGLHQMSGVCAHERPLFKGRYWRAEVAGSGRGRPDSRTKKASHEDDDEDVSVLPNSQDVVDDGGGHAGV